jgi:ribosome-binding ATPase YchF (GTP1/OBG family)
VKKGLEENKPVHSMEFSEDEEQILKNVFLLTSKPVIYVANVSEDDLLAGGENQYVKKLQEYAKTEEAEVVSISAKIEAELG